VIWRKRHNTRDRNSFWFSKQWNENQCNENRHLKPNGDSQGAAPDAALSRTLFGIPFHQAARQGMYVLTGPLTDR